MSYFSAYWGMKTRLQSIFCTLTCSALEKGKKAKRSEKGRKVCIRLNYSFLMGRFYQATYVANCRHTNASSLMKNSFNRTGGKLFQIAQNISRNRSNFNFKGQTKVPTEFSGSVISSANCRWALKTSIVISLLSEPIQIFCVTVKNLQTFCNFSTYSVAEWVTSQFVTHLVAWF